MTKTSTLSTRILGGLAGAALLAGAAGAVAADMNGVVAHGGRLYDKWYKEADAAAPQASHALYPADKKYASKPKANWRCKECHGWDYKGASGAYAKGKHSTGIKGIWGMRFADPAAVVKVLSGEHGYAGKMSDADLNALAMFVTRGQIDTAGYVDGSKMARGDAGKGAGYYNTLCAQCHGDDGRELNFKTPEKPEYVGTLANANPWEFLHKVWNGQPAEQMPALRALDPRIAVDILAHAQSLPAK